MVETTTSAVADFVARAKQLISRSEFKAAVKMADSEYEQIMSSSSSTATSNQAATV